MSLSTSTRAFLLSTIRNYFSKDQHLIILFGSYAKGTSHETSDIDIAIKGEHKLEAARWQALESALEESYLPQKVDIIDYHRVSKDCQNIIDQGGIMLDAVATK